ncbi:MAG: hypothetical protein ABW168_19685 [Sedimenticola sp.]
MDVRAIPSEIKYLIELLAEAQFYHVQGLADLILTKLHEQGVTF